MTQSEAKPKPTQPSSYGLEERLAVCQQVAQLVEARLPISGELGSRTQSAPSRISALAQSVETQLAQGKSLAAALASDESRESRVLSACIVSGELSDRLDHALHCWTNMHFANRLAQRRLRSALVYPFLLVVVTAISLTYVIWALIPEYRETYALFDKSLPAWLHAIVWIREQLAPILLGLLLAGLLSGTYFYWRYRGKRKRNWPAESSQRLRLQALASEMAASMLNSQVALNQIAPLTTAVAGGDRENVDEAFSNIQSQQPAHPLNRESSMLLSAVHAGIMQKQEAVDNLSQLADHMRDSADTLSARKTRWIPMLTAVIVGLITLFVYVLLIYLPWIWLLTEIVAA